MKRLTFCVSDQDAATVIALVADKVSELHMEAVSDAPAPAAEPVFSARPKIWKNDRLADSIMDVFGKRHSITRQTIIAKFGEIPSSTLSRALRTLEERGQIVARGNRNKTYFKAAPDTLPFETSQP